MKDLVDHIRTVHFTVFVVALVMTVALYGPMKPHLERAASDAEALLLLEQKWRDLAKAFRKAAADAAKGPNVIMVPEGTRLIDPEPGLYTIRNLSVYPRRPIIFEIPKNWIYVDGAEPDENPGWGESQNLFDKLPQPWSNFKQFLHFWDDHRQGKKAFLLFSLATRNEDRYCNNVEKISDTKQITPTAFLVPSATFQEKWLFSSRLEGMDVDPNKHKTVCGFEKSPTFWLKLDLAALFAGITPQAKKWGNGSSADEFKDLIDEAKHLEESPLKDLAAAVRERANSDTERVELFQAKLPVETIATYGALILIICQLYLWAHLRELRRLAGTAARSDWPTGYIGLYENYFILFFTLVSTVLWPPYPLLMATQRATSNQASLYFSEGAMLISVAIGVASAATLLSIRKLGGRPETTNGKSKAAGKPT